MQRRAWPWSARPRNTLIFRGHGWASVDFSPFLAFGRPHGRRRAEQANDLLGDLAGRWADVDNQGIFVRSGFLQNVDLTLQQARGHEVTRALGEMVGHDLPAAAKIDHPDFRPITDDDPAIRPLQRGAGNDAGLLAGALAVDPGSHAFEPGLGDLRRSAGVRHASWRRWLRDGARRPPRNTSRGAPASSWAMVDLPAPETPMSTRMGG